MTELFFEMATIFLNLTNRKKINRQRLYTPESFKIGLFKGEKVFSYQIIYIFGSCLTVCVLLKLSKREERFKELGNDIALNLSA